MAGTFDIYSFRQISPYTGISGLPYGFEQAADFYLGAVAESENQTWCRLREERLCCCKRYGA